MKKLNPKLLSIAFILLSLLIGGSFTIKNGIAPGGGTITDDSNPGNGGD